MLDELILNTKFARWVAGRLLRKTMNKKANIRGDVAVKKLVVRSDEKTATVDVELKIVMNRDDAERLIKQALKEDP